MGTPTEVTSAAPARPSPRTARPRPRWKRTTTLLLALAALGLLRGTGHAAAPADVPPDHWARGAVEEMIDRGVLGTQDGGLFRGEQPVTRYDLAVALARVLQEAGRAAQPLDDADLDAMRTLADRFREDVVTYYQSREAILEAVRLTQTTVAVLDETLNLALNRLDRLQADMQERERRWEERLAQLTARVEALQEENRRLAEQLAALNAAGQ